MRKVELNMKEKQKYEKIKEYLEEEENIKVSYAFIYKTLTKAGILSPKARRKTKRDYAKQKLLKEKKINLAMSDEQISKIVNHEIALEDSHPRGEKPKYFGEITEMDGSTHLWFGDKVVFIETFCGNSRRVLKNSRREF